MFGKLKDKLKSWVKKVSDETERIEQEKKIVQNSKKTKKEKKLEKKKKYKKEDNIEKELQKELEKEEIKAPPMKFNIGTEQYEPDLDKIKEEIEKKKKQSFFSKISSSKRLITEEFFEKYHEDLEMLLLENNVALEVADKIISYLKTDLIGQTISKKEIEEKINKSLKEIIQEVLVEPFDLLEKIKEKKEKPFVILFCGINGTGKTTTIAKISNLLNKKKISSVLGAGDTFRAASIEQLKKHGENIGVKVISYNYGTDPAAVGFDTISFAKKNKIDVVLIDTAGRMHTAKNLLDEMKKIKKVCAPDLTIFVGEAITGNDSTEQVKAFNESIGIDAIILNKADIDEKGGTALSVGYTTNKPIIYLGMGQEYDKIEKFDKKKFIEKLGL